MHGTMRKVALLCGHILIRIWTVLPGIEWLRMRTDCPKKINKNNLQSNDDNKNSPSNGSVEAFMDLSVSALVEKGTQSTVIKGRSLNN